MIFATFCSKNSSFRQEPLYLVAQTEQRRARIPAFIPHSAFRISSNHVTAGGRQHAGHLSDSTANDFG